MQAVAHGPPALRARRHQQGAQFAGLSGLRVCTFQSREQCLGLFHVSGLDLDRHQQPQCDPIFGCDGEELAQRGCAQIVAATLAPEPRTVEQRARYRCEASS